MKKKITAVLAAASLLFAVGAIAEDNVQLPGTRVDAAVVQSTPAAQEAPEAEVEIAEIAAEPIAEPTVEQVAEPVAEPIDRPYTKGRVIKASDYWDSLKHPRVTEEYRFFISQYDYVRTRKVRYYDNVYCYNHGDYYLTPFDSKVSTEYLTVDETDTYAVAPIVLDITDAMRVALYGGDVGEVSMFYGQYCERRGDGHGNTGFTGVHEGIDFTNEPKAPLFSILGGEVTRAGDSNGTVAVYNAEYDVTVLYLHCEDIVLRRGDLIEAGVYMGVEGKKGSGSPYTHVEMRSGRHTTTHPYRNTILESDCPYPVMQEALGVVESGRQPVTAAAVMEAQRMREEAEAAAKAAAEAEEEAEPEIELIDVLETKEEGYGFAEATVVPEATLPPTTK